jgi:hypothetical protein
MTGHVTLADKADELAAIVVDNQAAHVVRKASTRSLF